jgi:hypothetical protein
VKCFFLPLISIAGLVSCSSSPETGLTPPESGKNEIIMAEDGSNNPFTFKPEDVLQGDDGTVTGGKRSQYDSRMESAYAKANSKVPSYMQSSYQKAAWSGGKNYGTGSYKTSESDQGAKKSWFGGRKSKESSKVARASGQDFSTGSFQTGSANETGRTVKTGSNAYAESRSGNAWAGKPVILTEGEYRSISMGQAKSLLGR